MVWHRQHLLQVLCQQRDQQRLHQFRGLEEPEKNDHGSFCWLHNRRKTNICIILCTRPADRLLCYWLAACLWPGSCPRFSWEFDFSLLDRFPGASKDKRLSSVFRSMQSFYRRYSVDNRLDTLTMGMLRKTDKKQTKSQLPSLEHLLEKPEALLDKSNTFENTIFQATLQMNACYSLLSRDLWNPQELATAGQRFLLLYVSLSDSDPEGMFWRFKPKHHLFQELCEFDECCPWIGHIEMKIWVGQWLLFQEEGVENLVCHLVFACFFSPCFILIWFGATWSVTSEENTIASTSGNTLYKFMSQHELPEWPVAWREKKGILVKQTLAHICFLFISFPMTWALAGTYYILVSSRIWK